MTLQGIEINGKMAPSEMTQGRRTRQDPVFRGNGTQGPEK